MSPVAQTVASPIPGEVQVLFYVCDVSRSMHVMSQSMYAICVRMHDPWRIGSWLS